jgi:hypothetical protein
MRGAEVQRKVRVTAAVITQRPAERTIPGPDRGIQVGPVIGTQPHRVRLVPVAPLRIAPGHLAQERLATRLTRVTPAALVPGQERAVWWRRGGEIPPLSRVTGHLRHEDDTTVALGQIPNCVDCARLSGPVG